jgi:flagellar basal-body rod protein FlgG
MRSLGIAATGMQAQQLNVDVISNNIANLNTTAFKRQRAEFQDLIYQNLTRAGSTSSDTGRVVPTGVQIGLGVNTGGVYRINEQGTLKQTFNDFDMAIDGKGYFMIILPDGSEAYSRAGSFQVNQDGEIVTPEGYTVSPGITIPADSKGVDINDNGEVLVTLDGQVGPQNVGQLDVVRFVNEAGLSAIGHNLLLQTAASGDPIQGFAGDVGFGKIKQRFLEISNVDAVTEITDLITAQRSYELNSNVLRTTDEMMQTVSQIK